MVPGGVVKTIGRAAKIAERKLIDAMERGAADEESDLTSRLLQAFDDACSDVSVAEARVRIFTKTFRSRGPGASEKRIGADFAIVLSVQAPNFRVEKGLLVQAKLEKPGLRVRASDGGRAFASGQVKRIQLRHASKLRELQAQSRKMLQVSAASFVAVYSEERVVVVPAAEIDAIRATPCDALARPFDGFMKDFAICTIGDKSLAGQGADGRPTLIVDEQVPALLHLIAEVPGD
jgi:hypothetical protein